MDPTELTLAEARRQIELRQLSPLELVEAYLARIERINPKLNCYLRLTDELALEQAKNAEKALRQASARHTPREKSLLGIPIALKDLYETQGIETTAGSSFLRNYIPQKDARTVERLKQTGAVLLGKLNMHEVALGVTNVNPHFGACRNPWNRERISGGSSGGSAAALAARLCAGSLGTDSGGSIRIPASLCGIVGLKPTYGRVSLSGVLPLSWNTDHAGPMARSVEDAAILLQVIAGYDPDDPASVRRPVDNYLAQLKEGVRGWRIALATDELLERNDPEIEQATQAAAQAFKALGAQVETQAFPGLRVAGQANLLMVTSDATAYHRENLQNHPEGFGEDVLRRLRSGSEVTSSDYSLARRAQAMLRRQFERFFEQYELLILPTTPVSAPSILGPDAVEQARLLTRYTAPFNLTGLPAISIPAGFTAGGLPIGLQLVTRPWNEARLLQGAYAYEQAHSWQGRKLDFETD
jgi:aspartyl-tRNA(Asn)/glutamyl-tRNA(Gln) amidotransferase subunit A